MSTSDLKLSLVQRLLSENDRAFLDRLRDLFERRDADDVDLTDAELAELEGLRARRLSGESKGHSLEEAMRLVRERLKKG
ncbi:MAG: hypothetical protein IPG10_17330 [Flavobacteriales bacterium]|jgi:hypothetical protein|nr:hypothetical protein [Flavobacteriales bacterium]MBK6755296.1 hypothetical protein [Flavobacteriales bacterium]MBK7269417.1 hypothetical protein [Flavobacteriales bacterium]MBK7753787.1 hypothetical protein [Flavobacteriales bacterium]MBK9075101.1 hypothetical protein [Flavobacteriales bacterium]